MDEEEAHCTHGRHTPKGTAEPICLSSNFLQDLVAKTCPLTNTVGLPTPRKQRYNNDSITDSFILGKGSISWEKRQ